MSRAGDREIAAIEDEIASGELTEKERKTAERELRALERDQDQEQRWRERGAERGWI